MAKNQNQIYNLQPDGYGKLVQYINGKFYDGFGNLINLQTIPTNLSDSERYLVLDGNIISISKNPVKLSFDFSFQELNYLYISPDRMIINSYTSSNNMGLSLSLNGSTYQFGQVIEQFGELLVQVDKSGLLILQGYKL